MEHPRNLKPAPAVPVDLSADPPPGTRDMLLEMGPQKFAEWVWKQTRLLVTDTTFRDAHQSLLATRVRTFDLLGTAEAVARRLPNLFSWRCGRRHLRRGPAVSVRGPLGAAAADEAGDSQHLLSDAPAGFQCGGIHQLSRQCGARVHHRSRRQGIDVFRVFDSLNDVRNMEVAMEAVRDTHAICEAAICYTGDLLDPRRPKYNLNYTSTWPGA